MLVLHPPPPELTIPAQSASPVAAARRIADAVLRPAAELTDQSPAVPRSHLDALAEAGLQGLMGPEAYGGKAASVALTRQVFEILAGACAVSFFVWVQHHAPVRFLADSPNDALRERHLGALCRGELLGGVAFAHLRRRPGAVVARRVPGGYRVDGEAPWVTSWGLAGLYAVAATVVSSAADEPTGAVLYFCLRGAATEQVRPSPPLALAAMNASSTVRLAFADHFVADEDVIFTTPRDRWERRDRVTTAQPNPACFGIAATAVERLHDVAPDAAATLGSELTRCRDDAYRLADANAAIGRLVEARAWGVELAVRCALTLVVSTGGRAMELSNPAQRLLREATFFTIQAQTEALRAATTRRLLDPVSE